MIAKEHAAVAAGLLDARRARDAIFGADADGFGEAAWDMLLALTVQDAQGLALSADALMTASAVPADIAERYLQWLSSRQLVDAKAGGYGLTERGRGLMAAYLDREGGIIQSLAE